MGSAPQLAGLSDEYMYRVGIRKKCPEDEGVLYVLFHLGLKWPLKQSKGYFEEAGS